MNICQGTEERAALDEALIALGLVQDNTCTYAVLKAKISKVPYAVLGVKVGTNQRELHTAYLRKAKKFHSDRNFGATELEKGINKVIFELVMKAREELKEPEKKRRLDNSGRYSQESDCSQASLQDQETASQESWHEENSETGE